MKSILLASIWLIFVVFVSGCRPPESGKLSRAFNDERKARLIPIIPEHWNWDGGVGEAHWSNPAMADPKTTNNAMHSGKEILVAPERYLHQECDFYYSGKKYTSKFNPDFIAWEKLTIRYDYTAARSGKNPWRCTINCGPHFPDRPRADKAYGEITMQEAETILKEWGISRLNY